jgi:hypothetical protein
MPKIPDCDRCIYYSHSRFLVCAIYPSGPDYKSCADFESAELWQPEDPETYQDIHNLDEIYWHPLFTGECPECGYKFSRYRLPPLKWKCIACGWDDEGHEFD